NNGFHACENPLDVLDYYDLIDTRFAAVTLSGTIETKDNKSCSAKIKIEAELTLPEFIKTAVKNICTIIGNKDTDERDSSQLAASGHFSQLAASGDSSQLAASGHFSQLAASGD